MWNGIQLAWLGVCTAFLGIAIVAYDKSALLIALAGAAGLFIGRTSVTKREAGKEYEWRFVEKEKAK